MAEGSMPATAIQISGAPIRKAMRVGTSQRIQRQASRQV